MKLGSLFDGSGGFPLSGYLMGIEPVWAAEVEPYPIAVTKSRFPNMKHLGSVTDVHGGKIEPVDIICFGAPCQVKRGWQTQGHTARFSRRWRNHTKRSVYGSRKNY